MNVRLPRIVIALAALSLLVVACGNELDPAPTSAPTALKPDATPSGLTAGTLAGRIAAGWETIDRYRAETTSSTHASPVAAEEATLIFEEAILPDQRRQTVTRNGEIRSEIVAAGGNIFGRGPELPGIAQPNRDPDVWITINGNVLGPGNPSSGFYQSLLLPVQPPYSALDEADRARSVEELATVEVTGRICRQYRLVDTTLTGDRVEITIALEESGLVCSIETVAGDTVTTTVYTYDQPAEIALPASPVPAPAENG